MTAREMMFGTREPFDYFECGSCGTLQITRVPSDLARHYPAEYLSFGSRVVVGETLARRVAARLAGKYLLTGNGTVGKFIIERKPWIAGHFPPSLRDPSLNLRFDSKILDFGCGDGNLLRSLHFFGFTDLTGADAFIDNDINYPTGVTIFKRGLGELEGTFDLIMLHHSFEHLPDPLTALEQIRGLMRADSHCLVRMPVLNFAWERYGVDWVQMDPPRHLFLFRESGFRRMAERSGFDVEKIVYDSGEFQFWGSEQYRLDVPLNDVRSRWVDPASSLFTSEQIEEWENEATRLNETGRGDMACFYLRKA